VRITRDEIEGRLASFKFGLADGLLAKERNAQQRAQLDAEADQLDAKINGTLAGMETLQSLIAVLEQPEPEDPTVPPPSDPPKVNPS